MGARSARLALTLLLLSAVATPATQAKGLFSPEVERDRHNPAVLESKLRREWAQLGQELASDLYACRAAKGSGELDEVWQRHLGGRITVNAQSLRVDRFWSHASVVSVVPTSDMAAVLLAHVDAHRELEGPCASFFKNGSGLFVNLAESLLALLDHPAQREFIKAAAIYGPWIPDWMMRALVQMLPTSLHERMRWMREEWFLEAALTFWRLPATQAALRTLLSLDAMELRAAVSRSFDVFSPTRIAFAGLIENNQTFPFVRSMESLTLERWPILLACAGAWKVSAAAASAAPDGILNEGRVACPTVPDMDLLALIAIEDRLPGWFFPQSFKIAVARKLNSRDLPLPELNAALAPMESFTYAWRKAGVPRGLNHLIAPIFARGQLRNHSLSDEVIDALVFMQGLGYQFFDVEAKLRLRLATREESLRNSVGDLKHWTGPTLGKDQ